MNRKTEGPCGLRGLTACPASHSVPLSRVVLPPLRYFLRSSVPSVSPRPSLSLHSPLRGREERTTEGVSDERSTRSGEGTGLTTLLSVPSSLSFIIYSPGSFPFPPFYTRHPAFGRPEGKVTGVRNGVRERRTSEGSEEPKEPNGLNEDHE